MTIYRDDAKREREAERIAEKRKDPDFLERERRKNMLRMRNYREKSGAEPKPGARMLFWDEIRNSIPKGLSDMKIETARRPQMLDHVSKSSISLRPISPEQAEIWLRKNDSNRAVSKDLVSQYARAMQDHRWRVNGETIKVTTDGRLVDGQHRLHACVSAGCEFTSYVIIGVDFDTFDTIDIGKKRTNGDILGIDGCKNSNAVSASIRWLQLYRSGHWALTSMKLSADETRLVLAAEPAIEDSASIAAVARKVLAPGPSGALHYLFSQKDREAADLFFADLASGSDLGRADAVYLLREKLLQDRMAKTKLRPEEVFSLVIRAWNRRRRPNDRSTSVLKGSIVRADGKRVFPEIS